MKNQKKQGNSGIALITLVIAVSILIIVSSMLIYNARNGINMRNLKQMQNDIEILNDKVNSYYLKYGALPLKIEYTGTSGFTRQPNDGDKYYVIDLEALDGVTLNYGADHKKITSSVGSYDDIYIINEQSHHIYYVRGISLDGVMYYTNDTDSEITLIEKWRQEIDEKGNRILTNGRETIQIGDYVYYDPVTGAANLTYTSYETKNGYANQVFRLSSTTGEKVSYDTTKYKWKVLGVSEKGELLIVSEDVIQPVSGGTTESGMNYYTIYGEKGYKNIIEELDKISEIYGQGYSATGARSIRVEDVNKLTGFNPNNVGVYDPEQKGHGKKFVLESAGVADSDKVWNKWDEGKMTEFENEITYYWDGTFKPYYMSKNGEKGNLRYSHDAFVYYDNENLITIPKSLTATTENMEKIVTLKNTFYLYNPCTLTLNSKDEVKGIKADSKKYNMLFKNKSGSDNNYWLASTCIFTPDAVADYCIRIVNTGYISVTPTFYSNNIKEHIYTGIRPVVSLEPYTELSGNSNDGWTIIKK